MTSNSRYQMSKAEYALYCFECECNGEIPLTLEFINGVDCNV